MDLGPPGRRGDGHRRRAALAHRGRRPHRRREHRGSAAAHAPKGDYIVETKLTIDLGVDTVRNYQQAGLIAYAGDFARLSHVAIWNTRQIEFGRELQYADRLSYGGMVEGPPAGDDLAAAGPHHRARRAPVPGRLEPRRRALELGRHLDLPSRPGPRIGLISHGGNDPQATALFDYFRVYRAH